MKCRRRSYVSSRIFDYFSCRRVVFALRRFYQMVTASKFLSFENTT